MSGRAGAGAVAVAASRARSWATADVVALAALLTLGVAVRVAVLPAPGLVGDLDQFVRWVHGIAVGGFANAYDQNLSFPPVMAWIWGILAAIQPGFATTTEAADPAIRALMKVPASLADLGLAIAVAWWFRDRPRVAVLAAAAMLLWPATWYVSAWWGQYEPIYVLPAVLAVLAARAGRPGLVAVLVAVSLMTKPQALPLAVPFAAWFLATQGVRGTVRAIAIGGVTIAILWLPFLGTGGPLDYLANLRTYQDDIFNVLSLRAWNPWWLVQELLARGQFVADGTSLAGPLSLRLVGVALAVLLALVVFIGVYRDPSPERLALGLAAAALVAFTALTTMHERYAYPALVFLLMAAGSAGGRVPAPSGRTLVAAWAAFAVAFAANLVVAVPPGGSIVPLAGPIGIVGAVVITSVAVLAIAWTAAPPAREGRVAAAAAA